MGWQDRDYASEYGHGGPHRPHYRGSGMGAWDVVTKIIIANIAVYFLMYASPWGQQVAEFGVMHTNSVLHGQIWRLFTATYMHAGFMHIFFNMLMLYFFGPLLERRWGGKQFFIVYTLGGIAGNVVLTLAGWLNFINPDIPGLGASGSVWTLMAAAAMYYPNAEVLIYFLVPVRLRTVVIVYGIWFVWNIMQKGANFGGDLCHMAGLLVGLWWAKTGGWSWAGGGRAQARASGRSWFDRLKSSSGKRSAPADFRTRTRQREADAQTVDRILDKVYEKGVGSLTPEEKKTLTEASDRLRQEDARADRASRL